LWFFNNQGSVQRKETGQKQSPKRERNSIMDKASRKNLMRQFGPQWAQMSTKKRLEALEAQKKLEAFRRAQREEATRSPVHKHKRKDAANDQARARANQELDNLLKLSKGSLDNLLPVVSRRVGEKTWPAIVLQVLMERIREAKELAKLEKQPLGCDNL
jgi:uncharacterized membrane protein YgaE (UPF0421/DUF939 family)